MELCVLASGSSGNASLLRSAAGGCLLIDAGIGPRTLAARLDGTGCQVENIRAIVLTHLDQDHFSPRWLATIVRQQIAVFVHTDSHDQLLESLDRADAHRRWRQRVAPLVQCFGDKRFSPIQGVDFLPLRLAHDQAGSSGFVIAGRGCRIGYATDLGRVPPLLLKAFVDLDVVALEANYDPQMQLASSRPEFLKRRIMGGSGHLSNEQALSAIQRIFDQHEAKQAALPSHVVLLHRSRQCNCPDLLRRIFSADARLAPRLTLAHQDRRTEWLAVKARQSVNAQQLLFAV